MFVYLLLALLGCDCSDASDDTGYEPPCVVRVWYLDADGDLYGDNAFVHACEVPVGYVDNDEDCDDADDSVNPGMDERCDPAGDDEDCDGLANDGDEDPEGATVWYDDNDRDGFGSGTGVLACDPGPGGGVHNGDDCDDNDPEIGPCDE